MDAADVVPYAMKFKRAGKKGQELVVSTRLEDHRYFRGDHVVATDSWAPPGTGTRIVGLLVGHTSQQELPGTVLTRDATAFFKQLNTCVQGNTITFVVLFEEDCEWSCRLEGKAYR